MRLRLARVAGLALLAAASLAVAGCSGESSSDASSSSDLAAAPAHLLGATAATALTPFGKMNPACVHQAGAASESSPVDESASVAGCLAVAPKVPSADSGGTITADTDTEPPGWVEWADQDLASGVSFLSADFTVPATPSNVGDQVIFLFPSLTPATNPPIIQPVLQFGEAANGGGKYWAIANWYLTEAANSYTSKLVKVSPGDKLRGTIEGTGTCSAGRCTSWTITLADLTQPTLKTVLTTEAGRHHFVQLQGAALETYQMTGCDQYPPSPIAFTNITVKTNAGAAFTPTWNLFENTTATPDCGFEASSPSPSEIDLAFTTK
jgi:hypothetical protein